ncbi:MAG: hypothetical protein HC887_06330 [Desulfobacteraceae bacterium]|nr:hypothetical protein [Desulfobacteraceae bacterium]
MDCRNGKSHWHRTKVNLDPNEIQAEKSRAEKNSRLLMCPVIPQSSGIASAAGHVQTAQSQ